MRNFPKSKKCIIRLDDASEYMDINNWLYMKDMLDRFDIKPIFGIIPNHKMRGGISSVNREDFWKLMREWVNAGWIPALHGYEHAFETNEGGINSINRRSEFAGLPLEVQKIKIKNGYDILLNNGIRPEIFFAPAHTFDKNTLNALESETRIRIISDTFATDVYYENPFFFIPQQGNKARDLPFKTMTFCYHPNIMKKDEFTELEVFFLNYKKYFDKLDITKLARRKKNVFDTVVSLLYLNYRKFVGRK